MPAQPPTQQENPNTPPQPSPLEMSKFQGLFTSTTRPGVKEEQCWWIDGFMPLGEMDLRVLPDVGDILWTVPGAATITFFDFGNIGLNPIAVVVLSDGSIYQVNTTTGIAVLMSGPGTISNPSPGNVAITQWGSIFILIIANQTDGYFIWNGTTFYKPGDTFGGGTVPTAIGGTAIETYQGRVWVANGATITFSAPGQVDDFSSGSGGGNFTSTDSFLRVGFTQLVQTNGFLYLIGDSSINYISGVQTAGSPTPITTFTNQNADPEVGTPYATTVDVFGRNIIFANAWGVHVSYGSAVSKVSEALDGFYSSVPNFGGLQLSAAKSIIYGKRVWILLCPVIDLFTGQQRNKLLMWNGQIWWASEQSTVLTYIQHQEINSVLTAWGTDGTNLRPLFQTPSEAFTKRVMSKLWAAPIGYQMQKVASRFWAVAQYYNPTSPDLTVYIQSENSASTGGNAQKVLEPVANTLMVWTTSGGTVMNWTTSGGSEMIWSAVGAGLTVFDAQVVGQRGALLGFTVETNCADMALVSAMLGIGAWNYRG